jgi:hypothetical protein
MAGEEILGHGKIVVEVDSNVGRELKEVEAQFDRTMAKLDRKEAELRLGANTSEFYAKLRKAQADKERWDRERATATLDVDIRKANAGFANASRRIKQYEAENVKAFNRIAQLDEDRVKAVADNEKKIAQLRTAQAKKTADAIKKAEQDAVRAAEDAAKKRAEVGKKAREAEVKAEQKRLAAAVEATRRAEYEKQRQFEKTAKAIRDAEAKDLRAREQAAARAARASERARAAEIKTENERVKAAVRAARIEERAVSDAAARRERELQTVKRDTVRYVDLLERRQKLVDKRNRIFIDKHERDKIDIKIEAHDEELSRLEERLHRLGHPPPHLSFDVDERGTKALSRWAAALSDTTVRLGPFTSTIGGAVRALTLLGPVVIGVAGAVGALAGAIGVGLAGGVGLGTAALTGFVPLVAGAAIALKPVKDNLKLAFAAQKKYNDAVAKYGSKSKQAKTAQEQLNSVFAHMPKQTAEAFKGLEKLKKSFQSATRPAADKAFGQVFSEGIKTADKLLPSFAARTRGFMTRAADGITEAFQRLRSKGGRDTLNNIFENANRSLTPLLHGLVSLGAAFGHIASDFSNYLPGLSRGFSDWADNVNKASKSVGAKNAVRVMVDGFKALIHITGSATRLLATFFGVAAGRGGGIDFLNSIADGMDRISANIRSNPDGLGSFFRDSIDTTKDLYSVLKPLAQVFVEWATIMRPFSDIILNVSATFGRWIAELSRFKGVRDLLVGAFGIFLAGTLAGKVLSVVDAVKELGAAFKALGAIKLGGAAVDFLTGGAASNIFGRVRKPKTAINVGEQLALGVGEGAAGAKGLSAIERVAGKSTTELNLLRGAAVGSGAAIGELSGASIVLTGGLSALAAAGGFAAYKIATMKTGLQKLKDSIKDTDKVNKDFNSHVALSSEATLIAGQAQYNYQQALGRVAALKKQLNKLDREGKQGTQEYKDKLQQLNTALQQRQSYEDGVRKAAALKRDADQAIIDSRDKQKKSLENWQKATDRVTSAQKDLDRALKDGEGANVIEDKRKKLADATTLAAKAEDKYHQTLVAQGHAARQAIADALNYQRELHGLVAASGAANTALANLYRRSQSLAKRVALKFADPKDAGRVASNANRALKSGAPTKIVTDIVVNSKNAEQAIRRLRAVRDIRTNLTIAERGGKHAVEVLQGIKGTKLTRKEQQIATAGGPKALALLAKIMGIKLGPKTQQLLEKGGGNVLARLARILGFRLPPKVVNIVAHDGASAMLNSLRAKAGQPIYQDVYSRFHGATGGPAHLAAGRGPGGSERALVGEGSRWQGAPEYVADHKSGLVVRVDGPTMMDLKPSQSVIPTEPRHRARGIELFKQFARDTGISMFAGGRGIIHKPTNRPSTADDPTTGPGFYPTKFTPREPGSYKTGKRKTNIKGAGFGKGLRLNTASPKAQYVKQLQEKEEDLGKEIDLQERSIKEPDTFLKKSGKTDGLGNDIYVVDQDLVNSYAGKLKTLKGWQENLQSTIAEEVKYLPQALNELMKARRDSSSNLHALTKEQTRLQKAIDNERNKKKPNKKKVHEWTSRLKAIKGEIRRETKIHDGSVEDFTNFRSRQKDAGFDYRNIGADIADTQADIDGVAGKASSEAGSDGTAVGGSGGGGAGGGGGDNTPGSLSIAKGDAEIGQGVLNGDKALQIQGYNDKISGYKDELKAADALLHDSIPGNDEQAYNMISEATSGINDATAAIAALNGTGDTAQSPDQQALLAQATTNAATAARAQKVAESLLSVFTGSGDLGRGGYTALGALLGLGGQGPFASNGLARLGGTTVVVNTLHPGDTRTLDAIGRAATAGQSLQGYRPTTRFGAGY